MRSAVSFARVAFCGAWVLAALVTAWSTPHVHAADKAPKPEDILKNLIIAGSGKTKFKPLPKIGVLPSTAINLEDITIRNVVSGDLNLCGEFQVLPDSAAPDGLYLSDSKVDIKAWKKKGAEAVVKVTGKKLKSGKVELTGEAYLVDEGADAVYKKTFIVDPKQVRVESHRVADALIGALTGSNGGFSSELTFIYAVGKQRRVYLMDSDGHDARVISPPKHRALATTFGPKHKLHWTASINKGRYKIYQHGKRKAIAVKPRGSVYGLAWSRKRNKVAVAIGVRDTIKLFRGPDLASLKPAFNVSMAMQPAWSSNDRLGVSAAGKWGQQIFVDGKAISPAGLLATAPTFCRNPNGIRAIYTVNVGNRADLIATGERGGSMLRLTSGRGKNQYPACSPDGRLVAFFSTRKTGKGPGLYVMRLDGRRAIRISTLLGEGLSWGRLPKGKHTRIPAYKAP